MDKEDRERLIRIDERTGATHRWTQDQEKRIRSLEASRNFQTGVGAVLTLAWGWVAKQLHLSSG